MPIRANLLPSVGAAMGAMLLLAGPAAAAPPRGDLRFGDSRQLPELGLQLRILANAREKPLPTPKIYPYQIISGTVTLDRVEWVAPREMWIAEQHAAEWVDAQGNALLLAVVRTPPPDGLSQDHVSREAYAATRPAPLAPGAWRLEDLARWASAYTGAALEGARPARRPPRLADRVDFTPVPADGSLLASVVRLGAPVGTRAADPDTPWLLLALRLGPRTDPDLARRTLDTRFWPYVQAMSGPAQPLASPDDAAEGTAPQRSDTFNASRRQATDGIRHLRDWWLLESDTYLLLTNIRTGERPAARALLADLERLHGAFAQMIPPRVAIDAVSVIRIPAGEAEYIRYVGEALAWSGGLWMPQRQELILRAPDTGGARVQRETLRRAAYHEAFHQYLHYALDRVLTSAWFNEGHAALFETVEIQSRGVRILEDPAKARALEALLRERDLTLESILTLSYEGFYAPDETERQANYVLAWGLVYYLRRGPTDRSPCADVIPRYIDVLMETRDEQAATRAAFAEIPPAELMRDLRAFWSSPARRAAAQRTRL